MLNPECWNESTTLCTGLLNKNSKRKTSKMNLNRNHEFYIIRFVSDPQMLIQDLKLESVYVLSSS